MNINQFSWVKILLRGICSTQVSPSGRNEKVRSATGHGESITTSFYSSREPSVSALGSIAWTVDAGGSGIRHRARTGGLPLWTFFPRGGVTLGFRCISTDGSLMFAHSVILHFYLFGRSTGFRICSFLSVVDVVRITTVPRRNMCQMNGVNTVCVTELLCFGV